MVRHTIQAVRQNAPVTIIHASRGKQARAEPVAALYEQWKFNHVDSFPALEDEMCTWEPLSAMPSPDRLDAMVWAMTDLAIGGGPMVYSQPAEEFVCDPIRLLSIWQRACSIDFDQTHFAVVWGAVTDRLGRSTSTMTAYRQYQRDDKGDLAGQDDHLMRATALLVLYGPDIAITEARASSDAGDDEDDD